MRRRICALPPLLALAWLLAPAPAAAQRGLLTDAALGKLPFRSVGPAVMGGRIHDIEGVPGDPATLYVASASGGLWKTTNGGITWAPIFEGQATSAFGDVALAPSNPNIVWAGTGEQNNRQSSTWGNGVYRSDDAGKTWRHLGLAETRHIGRVLVDPRNPDVAWVGALGNLWKASDDRGVYKTTDGGKSWKKVFYVDTFTGVVDMVMDPVDPNVVYAAAYQHLRSPWGYNGGGPGSGIYKTTDGGQHWTKLEQGLPAGDKGRIGLGISRQNPRLVYAIVEHATEAGFYRSDDAGQTWRKMSPLNPRPMYYSSIFVDPKNDQRVYMVSETYHKTEDGGATWRRMPHSPTYDVGTKGDFHTMWIDPGNPKHFLMGSDGGLHETFDMGETFRHFENLPVGQFYAIAVDDRDPYWVYGGMQDNHSWMGPSATRHWLGISGDDWRQIGFGDGMYQAVDKDGRSIYSTSQDGDISRVDAATGDILVLKPYAPKGEKEYRFDWTPPILASRHTPGLVYYGGNRLFISRDHGDTWDRTQDLSRGYDRDTLVLMGVRGKDIKLSQYDGEDASSEITTIAESPLDGRILWVGTDDGNVQLSRDGGKTWTNVAANIKGVPDGTWVSRVVASAEGPGAAYVAFDGHRTGDFRPYAFRTRDFGQSWSPIAAGLPGDAPVRVIHEYPGKPGLLFLGTEHALYVSPYAGSRWARFGSLPTTEYLDVLVHPREKDLVVATHGRSLYILDDASFLAEWSPSAATDPVHLFPVRRARAFHYWEDLSYRGQDFFAGANPADGALLTYILARPTKAARISITDATGRAVRAFDVPTATGVVQRVTWDLRHEPPANIQLFGGDEGTAGARGPQPLPVPPHDIGPRGPFVKPGTYTVTLTTDAGSASQTVRVDADPLLALTPEQHAQREAFLLDVAALQTQLAAMRERVEKLRKDLGARAASDAAAKARADSIAAFQRTTFTPLLRAAFGMASDFNGQGARQGSAFPPTADQRRRLAEMKATAADAETRLRALEGGSAS
ncbi:MAG TPA: hypothetical protein VFQ38_05365 [Longimicrobiales bacterium]|nr:hypothetical protein [Longimicrobiales bacterium]